MQGCLLGCLHAADPLWWLLLVRQLPPRQVERQRDVRACPPLPYLPGLSWLPQLRAGLQAQLAHGLSEAPVPKTLGARTLTCSLPSAKELARGRSTSGEMNARERSAGELGTGELRELRAMQSDAIICLCSR